MYLLEHLELTRVLFLSVVAPNKSPKTTAVPPPKVSTQGELSSARKARRWRSSEKEETDSLPTSLIGDWAEGKCNEIRKKGANAHTQLVTTIFI